MRLLQIDHEQSRSMLRQRSQRYTRMDFLQHLQQNGRPWLRREIANNGIALANFIDRTLDYDHRARSVGIEQMIFYMLNGRQYRMIRDVGTRNPEGYEISGTRITLMD